jgi:alkanesulfonate monooxygenase SsuD/methylene tetrahydromethanopterin reductase-like flavin-dependent oxidoreductase (luciferase family)
VKLSILDLAHVPVGSDVGQALRNTLDLARHADGLGYQRFWLAEHHNMPGIASAATGSVPKKTGFLLTVVAAAAVATGVLELQES